MTSGWVLAATGAALGASLAVGALPRGDLRAAGAASGPTTPASEPAPVPAHQWAWPLSPVPTVRRRFEPPLTAYGHGHRGVDLVPVSTPSAPDASVPVLAVADGVVTHVGAIGGRGTVTVAHDDGLRSTYEPVRSAVTVGEQIRRGEVLGVLDGPSHCDPGPTCLHLGAIRGDRYVDPLRLIVSGPVILLPLG